MIDAPLFLLGIGLFFIGTIGMLARRSLVHVLVAALISAMGAICVFAHYGTGAAYAERAALVFAAVFAAVLLVGAALAITLYRRRETINVDEVRELRG